MSALPTTGVPESETLKRNIEIDVSHLVPFAGTVMLRGWIRAPLRLDRTRPPVVLCCLPGGRCTTAYFDLQVPGHADYSMAQYLADRGIIVVAFDHVGLGDSSEVDEIVLVTPRVAAAANHHAHRFVLDMLASGVLVPELGDLPEITAVGVGHSMGGMILTVQQARHSTFDAVAVLGHGGNGLPQFLTEAERHLAEHPPILDVDLIDLARTRFTGVRTPPASPPPPGSRPAPGSFLGRDVPPAVRSAYAAQQAEHLFSCGLTSMLPHATDGEKAGITGPVFLGFGDNDLTNDFIGAAAAYTSCPDITLFVLPGSAHCHNQAGSRTVLWDRLAHWAVGV
ncbi:MAG TPA: alpha/beta hydrolase [Acidimicrobiales bacterium]|nr:alpha/beta hydrolase [Acidimicrobiales bacterium]